MLSSHNQLVLEHAQYLSNLGYVPILIHGVRLVPREGGLLHPLCSCWEGEACHTPGKHPVRGWKQSPMETPAQGLDTLRGLVLKAKPGQDFNIGVRTGPVSKCFAIDIDAKGNGWGNFIEFLKSRQINSEVHYQTLTASTGGGGRHLIFNYPNSAEKIPSVANHPAFNFKQNPRDQDESSVDIRGDGGYIVVWPSFHKSGGQYRYDNDPATARKDAPTEIVKAVEKQRRTSEPGVSYTPDIDELKALGERFLRSKKIELELKGRQLLEVLDGKPIKLEGGAHDVFKTLSYAVALEYPNAEPKSLAEFFRASIDSRSEIKTDASCTFADVYKCVESALVKRRDEAKHWENQLIRTKEGLTTSCSKNAVATLKNDPLWDGVFAYDARAKRPLVMLPPAGLVLGDARDNVYPRALTDADMIHVGIRLSERYKIGFRREHVNEAIELVSHEHSIDIFLEYLRNNVPWDGIPRLDTWLIVIGGAEDTPYTRAVSRKFLLQMAQRTLEPGCQADLVLILEGKQGIGKSSLLRALVPYPSLFCDDLSIISGQQNKDNLLKLQGPALVELAELSAMHKSDVEPVKVFLSGKEDNIRAPYARNTIPCHRRNVFAGTTNSTQYLRDTTGNRRFLPVALTQRVHVPTVIAVRDQLWAEAIYYLLHLKEQYHLDLPMEMIAEAVQSERVETELWFEPTSRFDNARTKAVSNAKYIDLTALGNASGNIGNTPIGVIPVGIAPGIPNREPEIEDPDADAQMFWLDKYDPNSAKVVWDEPLRAKFGELEHFSTEHVLKFIFDDDLGPQHRTRAIVTSVENSLKMLGYEKYKHFGRDEYRNTWRWKVKIDVSR